MINREIFTESPEDDLWRELLQYSYRANVSRYLKEHSLDEDEDTINTIIGSFLQANEYFKASKSANLQISPLLLYYGATNLLLGLTSLMTGKRPEIKNHGMTAIDSTISTYIAEANVVFGDPNTGGIHQFARILGFEKDLTKCGEWKMMDFLSSIVEIDQDYRKCYAQENGNTLLLDLFNTPTGTIERLYLNKNKVEAISAVLNNVEGFEKNYLLPQVGHERESDRDYLILRKKMSGKDIKRISFSGQPYLQAGFIKNGQLITLPPLFNMYQQKTEYRFMDEMLIDYSEKIVAIAGHRMEFTKIEYQIIEFLSMHPGQVFDKERIYAQVCGYDAEGDSRTITELVRRIRKKIADYSEKEYIETVWGIGYRWKK